MHKYHIKAQVSSDLAGFWGALPSNQVNDGVADCNNDTLTVFALNQMLSHPDLRPYSDIFVFTNQLFGPLQESDGDYGIYGLYERLQQKRVRVSRTLFFLLTTDGDTFKLNFIILSAINS